MTDTLPTVKELLANEELLRITAGEVLCEKLWHHNVHEIGYYNHYSRESLCVARCAKCHKELTRLANEPDYSYPVNCPVSDSATGSLPDIAEKLIEEAVMGERTTVKLIIIMEKYWPGACGYIGILTLWLHASADVHSALALAALRKARIE